MNSVELNLYRDDINVLSDHGCLARIARSVVVAIITLLVVQSLPVSREARGIVFVVLLLSLLFVTDKYIRRLYPDWPKPSNYAGTITFTLDEITITKPDERLAIALTHINTFLLFYDHYCGFRNNHRDIERNGNALVYLKTVDGQMHVFKFNIYSKIQFDAFQALNVQYETTVKDFRKYTTSAIPTILTDDYKNTRSYT